MRSSLSPILSICPEHAAFVDTISHTLVSREFSIIVRPPTYTATSILTT